MEGQIGEQRYSYARTPFYDALFAMVTLGHVLAVHFVADDKGAFTSAVGLIFDASPFLGGPRSKVDVLSSWDTS